MVRSGGRTLVPTGGRSKLVDVLVVPLTTNLDRKKLAGTALIAASDSGLASDSVALAFQMRAIPKASLKTGSVS